MDLEKMDLERWTKRNGFGGMDLEGWIWRDGFGEMDLEEMYLR